MTSYTTSNWPLNKLTFGALSAACVTVLVYVAGLFNVDLPPAVASSFTLIVFSVVVYFVPLSKDEVKDVKEIKPT